MATHPVFGTAIPPGWDTATVDSIKSSDPSACVAGPFGSNISSKYFVPQGVPVIRGSNLRDDLTRFVPDGFVFVSPERARSYLAQHVRPGDLVFTCWGTIGQVGLIPKDGPFTEYIISNKQLKLRADPHKADPEFLFYYFASPSMVEHIRNHTVGSAVPGINLGILKRLPVVLPPLPIQRKIAATLSAYDELIENNNRRIMILEEMARRIYHEWFVDFRCPGHSDHRASDAPTGFPPPTWAVERLGDHMAFVYGRALKAGDRRAGEVTVYGSSGPIGTHDVPIGAGPGVIVGRKGNVGSVYWSDGPFFAIDTTYWIRSGLPLTYCYFALSAMEFLDTHAAVPGLGRDQAYSKPLLVPDSETLSRFDDISRQLFALKQRHARSNELLQASRDLLLPRLVSGEIDVSNIDIAMPPAAP